MTCRHCGQPIRRTDTGWADSHPRDPYYCPHAIAFRHEPRTVKTVRRTEPGGPWTVVEVQPRWRPTEDAPGMYDEPDHGLALPLPLSDEEDRIGP